MRFSRLHSTSYNLVTCVMVQSLTLVIVAFCVYGSATATATSTNTEYPIKNVVVVMMENHSFDHMLGFLKRLNPEIDGLDGTETNPINVTDPAAGVYRVSDQAPFVSIFCYVNLCICLLCL
jgi:phospholipase C